MKIRCELVENRVIIENEESVDFGLRFYDCDDRCSTVEYVSDIFCDAESAMKIVALFNSNDISEVHINDIIEDLLCV